MFSLNAWTLGKVFGIPIRIDPSWLIIFFLLTYQLAVFVFPAELGIGRRRGIAWDVVLLAVIASLLLFASVLAHELAHAFMAVSRGVPVLGITLFVFGGVAQIGDEPDSPQTELLIAIVGPLISFLIAIVAGGIWIWTQALESLDVFLGTPLQRAWLYIAVVAFYLAQTNLLLAVFNLLPGFPLDGGRVLRAVVWAVLGDQRRATFIGMLSGRGLAVLLTLGGVLLIVRGEFSGGWLLLMAWFLWRAAGDAYHSMEARNLLKNVTVGELMRAPLQRVSEALSVRELADAFASRLRPPALAVDFNGNTVGLISEEQVRRIERGRWESTRVRQAMVPLATETTVTPEEPALTALRLLTEREKDDLLVLKEGEAVGSIGREELARYLKARGE